MLGFVSTVNPMGQDNKFMGNTFICNKSYYIHSNKKEIVFRSWVISSCVIRSFANYKNKQFKCVYFLYEQTVRK